jgi:hypothetical protein
VQLSISSSKKVMSCWLQELLFPEGRKRRRIDSAGDIVCWIPLNALILVAEEGSTHISLQESEARPSLDPRLEEVIHEFFTMKMLLQ